MKKAISLFLVLSLLTFIPLGWALADEYSFHSGVKFGMTKEEVKSAEKSNSFSCQNETIRYAFYDENGDYKSKGTNGLVVKGSIAGIPNSQVYYYFDDSEKLYDVLYVFEGGNALSDGFSTNDDILSEYSTIDKQLQDKYSDVWEDCSETFPSSIDAVDDNRTLYRYNAKKIRLNNEECLYISHTLSYMDFSDYETSLLLIATGHHFLEYRLIKDEELESRDNAIEKREEKERKEQEEAEKEKQKQRDSDL